VLSPDSDIVEENFTPVGLDRVEQSPVTSYETFRLEPVVSSVETEIDVCDDRTTGPRFRDIGDEAEPRGVPRVAPGAPDIERRPFPRRRPGLERRRARLDVECDDLGVDGGSDALIEYPTHTLRSGSETVVHVQTCAIMPMTGWA
jgi:hypothetical protein